MKRVVASDNLTFNQRQVEKDTKEEIARVKGLDNTDGIGNRCFAKVVENAIKHEELTRTSQRHRMRCRENAAAHSALFNK